MSAWELRCHVRDLVDLAIDAPQLPAVRRRLDRLIAGWAAAWSRFEGDDSGLASYHQLLASARQDLVAIGGEEILMRNGQKLYLVLERFVFQNLIFAAGAGNLESMPRLQNAIGAG